MSFKPYNFAALGAHTPSGALHPLNKIRHEFRNILFPSFPRIAYLMLYTGRDETSLEPVPGHLVLPTYLPRGPGTEQWSRSPSRDIVLLHTLHYILCPLCLPVPLSIFKSLWPTSGRFPVTLNFPTVIVQGT
jgi:hypothetical protein